MEEAELDVTVPEKLVEDAVRFHGHLGPFMVLGLKAGLLANKVLGKDYFKSKAVIKTEPRTPYTCFIDGVQFTTGCTMGKGNIKLEDSEGILTVTFSKSDRSLKLTLRADVLERIKGVPMEECERVAREILKIPVGELFNIE